MSPQAVRALRNSLDEIVRRHKSLRRSFSDADGVPVQAIAPEGARIRDGQIFLPDPSRTATPILSARSSSNSGGHSTSRAAALLVLHEPSPNS